MLERKIMHNEDVIKNICEDIRLYVFLLTSIIYPNYIISVSLGTKNTPMNTFYFYSNQNAEFLKFFL